MTKAKSIRGMHDLIGEDFLSQKKIIKLFESTAYNFNFKPIETPIMEFNEIFSINGSSTAPDGYRWLAGRGSTDANPKFNQWQTNLTKTDDVNAQLTAKGAHGMLDGHIWKIDIKL